MQKMYAIHMFANMDEFHLWAINQMYERFQQERIHIEQMASNPPDAMVNKATPAPSKPMSLNDGIKVMRDAGGSSPPTRHDVMMAEIADLERLNKRLAEENHELSKKLADIKRALDVMPE